MKIFEKILSIFAAATVLCRAEDADVLAPRDLVQFTSEGGMLQGRSLKTDAFGRKYGRCRNPTKCLEFCPGQEDGDVVWSCMKLEWCLIEEKPGSMCDWVLQAFCRRRTLQEVANIDNSQEVATSSNLRTLQSDEVDFDLCFEHPDRCPGACDVHGFCLMKNPMPGFCRVSSIRDVGSYYIGCKGCSLQECKNHCYRDSGCQGIEYRDYDRVCEIHRRRPEMSKPKDGAYCYKKPKDFDEEQDSEDCFHLRPELVAKGFCRDHDNTQGLYIIYKNIQKRRSWLRSHCKLLCENTPGCVGFEIYSSHCENHFREISREHTKVSNSKHKPECYIMGDW